jgi:hypothetical protein
MTAAHTGSDQTTGNTGNTGNIDLARYQAGFCCQSKQLRLPVLLSAHDAFKLP